MPAVEMTGLDPDPDCLHCVLVPYISRFIDSHPHKCPRQVIGELAQIMGEVIASTPELACQLVDTLSFINRVAAESAHELMDARAKQ